MLTNSVSHPPAFMRKSSDDTSFPLPLKLFFVLIHFIFSLDLGFVNPSFFLLRILNVFLFCFRIFSISSAMIFLIYDNMDNINMFVLLSQVTVVVHYVCYVIIFKYFKTMTMQTFLKSLFLVDTELNYNNKFTDSENLALIGIVLYGLCKAVILLYSNFKAGTLFVSWYQLMIFFIPALGFDIVIFVYVVILLSVRKRLNLLAIYLEDNKVDIVHCQYIFKYIADCTENFKQCFDYFFALAVFTVNPLLMFSMWFMLQNGIKSKHFDYETIQECAVTIFKLLLTFLPACVGSMVTNSAYSVLTALQNVLLQENRVRDTHNIKLFIWYAKARPFKFVVIKLILLSANFPANIISILVTYVIVIAQFIGY